MDATCSLLLFRNEVKTRYASQPHVYHHLVQLLQRFNIQKLDMTQLKASVDLLLSDNPDLIQKFNDQIVMLQHPNARRSKMFCESSRDFVLKVKDIFEKKGKLEQYKSFVAILRNIGSSSLKDTRALVGVLFHEEPQLLGEFEDMIMVEFLSEAKVEEASPTTISISLSCRSPLASPPVSPAPAKRPLTSPSSNIVMSAQRRKPLSELPKQLSASILPTTGYSPLTECKVSRSNTLAEIPSESIESKGKDKKSKAHSEYLQKDQKKDSKLNKILPRSFTKRIEAPNINEEAMQGEAPSEKVDHISNRHKLTTAILRIGKHWKPATSPPTSPRGSPRCAGSPLKHSTGTGDTFIQSVG